MCGGCKQGLCARGVKDQDLFMRLNAKEPSWIKINKSHCVRLTTACAVAAHLYNRLVSLSVIFGKAVFIPEVISVAVP